jgi:hypothetical protein
LPSHQTTLALIASALLLLLASPAPALTGGRALGHGEAPGWAARVSVGGMPTCSGVLIGTAAVLTAAHCVTDPAGAPLPARRVTVTLGQPRDRRHARRTLVTQVRVPTEFSPDHYAGDVAVLMLARSFPRWRPAPGVPPWRFASSASVRLYGYGPARLIPQVGAGQEAGLLRVAPATIASSATCVEDAEIAPEWSPATMQCLGGPGSRVAPCPQDSGGPAVTDAGVTGIISFSPNAACRTRIATVPSVLARIDCGPQREFVNRSYSPSLHVLTDAVIGPRLRLSDPDGFEVVDRVGRRYGDFWVASFFLDEDTRGGTSTLTIPGRVAPVPVPITGRVEARAGVSVEMPEGCPELPSL